MNIFNSLYKPGGATLLVSGSGDGLAVVGGTIDPVGLTLTMSATPAATLPLMAGTASAGTLLTYSRADHVHPVDTSRLAVTVAASTYAPLASPALIGIPTAPTAAAGNSSTQLATTAFVGAASSGLAPLASPALTGYPTAPTAATGNSSTQLATTAFVASTTSGLAPLASPALTGIPTAPTAAAGSSSTQLATTAFVAAAVVAFVRGTYTASGAISPLDTLSRVNSATAVTMTLANGTIDNRVHVIKQLGAGAISLQGNFDGTFQTITIPGMSSSNTSVSSGPLGSSLTVRYQVDLNSYIVE